MLKSADQDSDDDHLPGDADTIAAKVERQLNIGQESDDAELYKLQQQQRAAVERAARQNQNPASLHPDLQDLSFGELGASSTYVARASQLPYFRMADTLIPHVDFIVFPE